VSSAEQQSEQQYWLSFHVHVVVTDNYVVLLDLRRDKYIGVAREDIPALAGSVVGWPSLLPSQNPPVRPATRILSTMLAAGMLTCDPALGKEARPLSMPRPQWPAIEADLERRPRTTLRHVSQVLIAATQARVLLKWRPIETVVARVKARKDRRSATSPFDLDAARPLVEAFLYLRPLFFTAKDECLFDSLVLIEFLARHGLYPAWIIGVQTDPFKAHSWVQAGDHVLNDQPEIISGFTPILAV
jgi:hypothetical protein